MLLLLLLLLSLALHSVLYFAVTRGGLLDFANPLSATGLVKVMLADLPHPLSPAPHVPKPSRSDGAALSDKAPTLPAPGKTGQETTPAPQPTAEPASVPSAEASRADTHPTPPISIANQTPNTAGSGSAEAVPMPAAAAPVSKGPAPAPAILPCAREQLEFDIYWLGVYVGTAVLEAVNRNGTVTITSRVRSNAVISAFYKVEDFAESTIKDGRPVSFKLRQHEGNHRGDKETIFDPPNRKVSYFNHLRKTREEHATSDAVLWDVMSGFYYLRTRPLEEGRPVVLNIFDSNKFLNTEVKVLRKERLTLADSREVDTLMVQPVLNSEGLFKRKGEIFIWLTDDRHRTPVKVQTTVAIGKVTAELRSSLVEH